MSRKRKRNLPLITEAEVTDIARGGKAVARKDDLVIMVSHAVPGDIIDIQTTKKKKRYYEGTPVHFHRRSPHRTAPRCRHFDLCGGCKWQDMTYEAQLQYKEKQVRDQLIRLAGMPGNIAEIIEPILPSEETLFYRNKLEFTFSARRWLTPEEIASDERIEEPALGFHVAGLFDKVLDITECLLQPEPSNAIRNFIREYTLSHGYPYFHIREQHGLLRNLLIRTTTGGEVMVVVSFYEDDREKIEALLQAVQERFPQITSLQWVVNPKGNDTLEGLTVQLYSGRDHLVEELDGLRFKVSAKSFFQTNTRQAARLYRTVLDFAGMEKGINVYDLYSGTGTIGLFLARQAGHVICIESVEEAVRDAEENARLNNIENISFLQGEVKELFNNDLFKVHGAPGVVVLDPPRSGIHGDTVKMLLETLPEKIVYVSCNPATQARDIQELLPAYRPVRIRPVDMFPHTDHVENVVLLVKDGTTGTGETEVTK